MRIKSNRPPNYSHRIFSGFLWFPRTIQGETRWLERAAYLTQVVPYRSRAMPNGWEYSDIRWLDTEQEIQEAKAIA